MGGCDTADDVDDGAVHHGHRGGWLCVQLHGWQHVVSHCQDRPKGLQAQGEDAAVGRLHALGAAPAGDAAAHPQLLCEAVQVTPIQASRVRPQRALQDAPARHHRAHLQKGPALGAHVQGPGRAVPHGAGAGAGATAGCSWGVHLPRGRRRGEHVLPALGLRRAQRTADDGRGEGAQRRPHRSEHGDDGFRAAPHGQAEQQVWAEREPPNVAMGGQEQGDTAHLQLADHRDVG
mmetsp:Transcript_36500/g.88745  ORF Transcript_36500/g.88745 Transcript_36500/m.88745 type:complete len:233 (+) Transcript_36500:1634-2332(+)